MNRLLPKSGLRRSFSILAGGTVIAQAIAFAVSPILTRIYGVADFGYLQIFNSIIMVLLVVVAGRYELAIPLPEDDESASNLLAFALLFVAAVSVGTAGLAFIALHVPSISAKFGQLAKWLWLIPLSLAGAGFYQVLSYWSLRKKQYGLIAKTRVLQVTSRFVLQLAGGLLHFGLPGLLVGDTVARANGTGSFVRGFRREYWHLTRRIKWSRMCAVAREYRHFPLVFSASGLLNTAALAFPGLLLAAFFGPTVTGWFALVDRVLGIPSTLIGQSLQQVYVSEGAPLLHSNPIGLKHLFEKMIRKIYFIPLLTCTILAFFGPALFVFVFGEKWREAGEYARIMGFVDIAGLMVSPIEMTLTMLQLQKWRFSWDAGRLVMVTGAMLITYSVHPTARAVVIAYAASMTLGYFLLLGMCYMAIQRLIAQQVKPGV